MCSRTCKNSIQRTYLRKYSWCFQLFNFIHLLFRFVSFNFNFFVPFISLFLFCFLMLRFRKEEDEWDTDDSSLALIHSKKWLIKSEVYFSSSLGILRLFWREISLENIFHISLTLPELSVRKIPASSMRKSEQYRSWDKISHRKIHFERIGWERNFFRPKMMPF